MSPQYKIAKIDLWGLLSQIFQMIVFDQSGDPILFSLIDKEMRFSPDWLQGKVHDLREARIQSSKVLCKFWMKKRMKGLLMNIENLVEGCLHLKKRDTQNEYWLSLKEETLNQEIQVKNDLELFQNSTSSYQNFEKF